MQKLSIICFLITIVVGSQNTSARNFNPIIPDYIADPSVVMFQDTFYMYATTDINIGLYKMGIPVVWKSADFVNWSFNGTIIPGIDWDKAYTFTDKEGKEKKGHYRYWAPGKPIKKDNKYYLFPTIVTPDEQMGTYVMVADRPEGPFWFTNGNGLFFNDSTKADMQSQPLISDIDGEPFIDDDGQYYIYWRRRNAAAMSNDLTSLTGETIQINTTYGGYSEGPVMFKRNDLYFYIYTLSGHANYCNGYMVSNEGPLGPFQEPKGNDVFIHSNIDGEVWGPGHGNVFQMPGKDENYFLYLEYGEGGTTRQVYANKMEFNYDGSIKTITPDKNGVGYLNRTDNRKNLALGAKITASSEKEAKISETKIIPDPNKLTSKNINTRDGEPVKRTFTYSAQNAADASYGTQWAATKDDPNPWLTIDLGKVQKISSCEIYFIFPTFGNAWKIETSSDGKKWKEKSHLEQPKVLSPHVINNLGKARYIKINLLEGRKGIWEVKLYE